MHINYKQFNNQDVTDQIYTQFQTSLDCALTPKVSETYWAQIWKQLNISQYLR